ncbi:hypothetical protein C8Q70DRAFT_374688 [Cubamyces menziesii]|nr:hypothetical protein C8Q70DRAFT_374688 [Cubamyces menziesii]
MSPTWAVLVSHCGTAEETQWSPRQGLHEPFRVFAITAKSSNTSNRGTICVEVDHPSPTWTGDFTYTPDTLHTTNGPCPPHDRDDRTRTKSADRSTMRGCSQFHTYLPQLLPVLARRRRKVQWELQYLRKQSSKTVKHKRKTETGKGDKPPVLPALPLQVLGVRKSGMRRGEERLVARTLGVAIVIPTRTFTLEVPAISSSATAAIESTTRRAIPTRTARTTTRRSVSTGPTRSSWTATIPTRTVSTSWRASAVVVLAMVGTTEASSTLIANSAATSPKITL